MNLDEIWQAVLGELELSLSKANFTTWFKNTSIIESNSGEFIIGVPNAFTEEWLKNKYHKQISTTLQKVTNTRITKITYKLHIKSTEKPKTHQTPQIQTNTPQTTSQPTHQLNTTQQPQGSRGSELKLNPQFVFETFIVGQSNELARAAASAVAQNPGNIYNPLFIYGGVGLGKTHLVNAIGNKILKKNPAARVVYVTCEKFTDDFISYIRSGKSSNSFKTKYRSADVLIIDDIQFLSGKEGTQEEFFHTFNELYNNQRQVILTSDRPPKAITALEDRLLSRFEGGMVADITLPDQETRKAILEIKCSEKGISLPEEVAIYIAGNIKNNIRELQGALSRLIAHTHLNNTEINLESTKTILSNVIQKPQTSIATPKKIIEIVAHFYDLDSEQLIAKNRKKEIAWPRQIAMYLMREEIKTSYPSIGQELGGRDHTTAMHACEKVGKTIEANDRVKQEIELIRQKIHTI